MKVFEVFRRYFEVFQGISKCLSVFELAFMLEDDYQLPQLDWTRLKHHYIILWPNSCHLALKYNIIAFIISVIIAFFVFFFIASLQFKSARINYIYWQIDHKTYKLRIQIRRIFFSAVILI